MENSNNYPSINKAVVGSKETTVSDPAEESGWTSYFEDLSNHKEEDQSLCSSFDSSSMVSDAASFPPWKSSQTNHVVACSSFGALPEKLTSKKTRAEEISLDDSLEDTASSPVNSPKGNIESIGLEQHAEGLETSERCEMNFSTVKNDCIDLKKRGLCLVPSSMLVNYLG
ncbi:vascular-related unknown protein 1-like isoform X2 [Populus nigra]|uniref:vascular-related unknown protein 1-like isoform X2 n=1 Tax=Populus nigra TaxID=3691 RepID=UPI002B27B3D4|nr:vascular-related unknown protein 1-like isoform X2 [Populus nigra]